MEADNWLDDIIEYDSGSSDKENEDILNQIRQPKTTNEQFNKISLFINEHDEKLMDKATYDLLWENLAAKLNDIGPPDHTTNEWRRIWSVHKYRNKRKRLDVSNDFETQGSVAHTVHSEHLPNASTKNLDIIIQPQSELSQKIDLVITNQNEMIVNQRIMIQELKNSNKFLEDIVKEREARESESNDSKTKES